MPRPTHVIAIVCLLLLTGCPGPAPHGVEHDPADLFVVVQNERWGYINAAGEPVIEPRFDRAWPFFEELALVEVDGKFGFIRPDGTFAIEPRFEDAWHFAGGVAPVQIDAAWGVVEENGDLDVGAEFGIPGDMLVESRLDPHGLQVVMNGERYGFETTDGWPHIDPTFEQAWYFVDGLARVQIDGKWGYIDREGRIVIEPEFDRAWDFRDGLARVQVDDRLGYIDREGNYVWQPSR